MLSKPNQRSKPMKESARQLFTLETRFERTHKKEFVNKLLAVIVMTNQFWESFRLDPQLKVAVTGALTLILKSFLLRTSMMHSQRIGRKSFTVGDMT